MVIIKFGTRLAKHAPDKIQKVENHAKTDKAFLEVLLLIISIRVYTK